MAGIIPTITIKKYKDGREVARFRDNQGLVRTNAAAISGPYGIYGINWVKAADIRALAEYGIQLQKDQVAAQLGSDGSPMPPLKGGGKTLFLARVNGKATFGRRTYADWKSAHGLQPVRDLYGPGIDGHMLDDIRINYLDDTRAQISLTRLSSRQKALANEKRAEWWGWNPASVQKMVDRAGQLFPQSTADVLYSMGLVGAQAVLSGSRFFRRVA